MICTTSVAGKNKPLISITMSQVMGIGDVSKCIFNRPIVGKLISNGCTTFTDVGNETFTTRFDGANIDHIVVMAGCDIYIKFFLPGSSWEIYELHDSMHKFLEMSEQIENGYDITAVVTGGGDYPNWSFYYENNGYILSGSGITVPISKRYGDACVRTMIMLYKSIN